MAYGKINNYVTNVKTGIANNNHAQLVEQNAADADAKTILPRCAIQNHKHFMAYIKMTVVNINWSWYVYWHTSEDLEHQRRADFSQ